MLRSNSTLTDVRNLGEIGDALVDILDLWTVVGIKLKMRDETVG